jgi:hypothetical protein
LSNFYNGEEEDIVDEPKHNPEMFRNEKEKQFYADSDLNFVRHHKRTSDNFHNSLQEILDSSKQTMAKGIKGDYYLSINYVHLNRACSLCHAWWTLQIMEPD